MSESQVRALKPGWLSLKAPQLVTQRCTAVRLKQAQRWRSSRSACSRHSLDAGSAGTCSRGASKRHGFYPVDGRACLRFTASGFIRATSIARTRCRTTFGVVFVNSMFAARNATLARHRLVLGPERKRPPGQHRRVAWTDRGRPSDQVVCPVVLVGDQGGGSV